MSAAGRRDQRVEFLRHGDPVSDGYQHQPGALTSLCFAWAAISYGTGAERRTAAQEGAVQPATFRVLANSITRSLTPRDKLRMDGVDWDIVSVVPWQRAELDVTAVRAA